MKPYLRLAIFLLFIVVGVFLAGRAFRQQGQAGRQTPTAEPYVTIDGSDPDGFIESPLPLWSDYIEQMATVGQVRHGERVRFVERSGEGILVETVQGVRGWIDYRYIREFR